MSISKSQSLKDELEREWGVPGIYLKHVESDLIHPDWVDSFEGISPEDRERMRIQVQKQRGMIGRIKDMWDRRKRNGRR